MIVAGTTLSTTTLDREMHREFEIKEHSFYQEDIPPDYRYNRVQKT